MVSLLRKQVSLGRVMAVALVMLVLSGGAFAANRYLITSLKQIKPSVLAQLSRKARGPAGERGPQGPVGTNGVAGERGAPGANGTNGVNGESVSATEVKTGEAACKGLGGSSFAVGGKETFACNGQTGYTETLPSGKSLTGEWDVNMDPAGQTGVHATSAVSFGIPLASVPTAHYIREDGKEPFYNESSAKEEEREQPACPGNVASPKASPGNLCVYAADEENVLKNVAGEQFILPQVCSLATSSSARGGAVCIANGGIADRYGFAMNALAATEGESMQAVGTWAVTAK